ncbi:hypothetical protein BSP38_249 [Bacillus phage BSP38]|uniref:Uncharacterized protein n=1 Tax=Bacillus phage BSP38 TaxID=2283013 RepID=A0A345MKA9_BPBSP|nr:hypothetical protein HWB82_gp069 [Bacillus phage BSP38]AXH71291.1 hypothetical protein BSP38_249 [Bacillus phage BSP38]
MLGSESGIEVIMQMELALLRHIIKAEREHSPNTHIEVRMGKPLYSYYNAVKNQSENKSLDGIEPLTAEATFIIWEVIDADTGEHIAHSYF